MEHVVESILTTDAKNAKEKRPKLSLRTLRTFPCGPIGSVFQVFFFKSKLIVGGFTNDEFILFNTTSSQELYRVPCGGKSSSLI